MQILLLIFCTLVVLEFGIHIVYHAVTGKAGLYDPAFSYLKGVFKWIRTLFSTTLPTETTLSKK